MKTALTTLALLMTMLASSASAQGVNLSGRWQCVALCFGPPGNLAIITQYGWEMNVLNEFGVPSRGWIDRPGRIWLERGIGGIFSPDGLTLQFDNGTVWQRLPDLLPLPPPPPPLRSRG
jgi:hypothetical protein